MQAFRLTRAIACVRISTHANLSARAICRMHEKSYSAEKVLFIEYSSFYPLNNVVYVNSVSLDTRANRTRKIVHTCDLQHMCRFAHEKD